MSRMTASPKPRVLVIGPLPPPVHGVTLCLQNLLAHREQLPVEIVHLDSRFTDSHGSLGKFSVRKGFRLLGYLTRLMRQLLFGRIRAVVITPTFYFKPFLKDALFIWCAWLLRKPVHGWIHNDFRLLAEEMTGWKSTIARTTLRRLGKIILVAPRLANYVPDWLDASRITVIENGVPDPPRHRDWSATFHSPPHFIYLSQMNDAKGWRDLLKAAEILAARGLHPEFHFYGRPAFETTPAMIESALKESLTRGVNATWHGAIYDDAKWSMLANADALIFPSWHEAFPLAILDAMAVGLPIVATDVGGVADALDDDLGGQIIPPRQPQSLALAMETLLTHSPAEMGRHNRQRYLANFTPQAYAERWAAFFHSLYESN